MWVDKRCVFKGMAGLHERLRMCAQVSMLGVDVDKNCLFIFSHSGSGSSVCESECDTETACTTGSFPPIADLSSNCCILFSVTVAQTALHLLFI